jgi:hypothetical protein
MADLSMPLPATVILSSSALSTPALKRVRPYVIERARRAGNSFVSERRASAGYPRRVHRQRPRSRRRWRREGRLRHGRLVDAPSRNRHPQLVGVEHDSIVIDRFVRTSLSGPEERAIHSYPSGALPLDIQMAAPRQEVCVRQIFYV